MLIDFQFMETRNDIDDDQKENIASVLIAASDVCTVVEDTWISKGGQNVG